MAAVPSAGRPDRAGCADAEALYERYARQILAYCLHQLGNREEAEDADQTTFLNAFRCAAARVAPEFEAAWLYKIAQNVCLTRQRSSSRRRRVEAPSDLDALQDVVPARAVDSDELIGLAEALDAMPEAAAPRALLREWQGLSYREISERARHHRRPRSRRCSSARAARSPQGSSAPSSPLPEGYNRGLRRRSSAGRAHHS